MFYPEASPQNHLVPMLARQGNPPTAEHQAQERVQALGVWRAGFTSTSVTLSKWGVRNLLFIYFFNPGMYMSVAFSNSLC